MPCKDIEKRREYQKKRYLENSKRINKVRKIWRKNNPEKQRKYYEKYRERKLKGDKQRREKVKKYVDDYKLSKGCNVCGYKKCAKALVFHHDVEKKFDIATVAKYGGNIERIKNEINKCIVLCRNCHAELHEKLRKEGGSLNED